MTYVHPGEVERVDESDQMKIAVCVKAVPDGRLRIDPVSKRLDRSGSSELNKFDTYAVEEALRIKERSGGEVVVASMGPENAAESLRSALGLGADRAVLVSDHTATGSDLLGTSAVLARVLERERPDLVLFGQQASDGGGALLWAAVAERMKLPVVSQVTGLTVEAGTLRLTRQTEFGDDSIETALPAIIAVTDAINEPRYASLKGMMGAKKRPLAVLSTEDLGMDPSGVGEQAARTAVLTIQEPPRRSNTMKVTDEGDGAEQILSFLLERQLL